MISAPQIAPYRFTDVSRDDEPRLHEINRRCPIEADFTFYFDRGQSFFAWPDSTFERHHYIGVVRDEELVGYGMVGVNRGWHGREQRYGRHFYLGDWRILPGHRGFNLGQLGSEALAQKLPDEVGYGYCLAKKGNAPVERILDTHSPAGWVVHRLCGFDAVNLLFAFRPWAPRKHTVRPARPADAEAVAETMRQAWRNRLFAPPVNPEEVRADLEQLQQGATGCYFIAERGGRCVGVLRAWDAATVRRTVVLGYSRTGKILRAVVAGARRVLRDMAPLPAPGGAFSAVTLHRIAVPDEDPAVLRDLLLAVMRAYHGRGYHIAHLGLCDRDPLAPAVRGLPSQRFDSQIHLFRRHEVALPEIDPTRAPWIDLQRI